MHEDPTDEDIHVGVFDTAAGRLVFAIDMGAVSYTHLDVYKRQVVPSAHARTAIDGDRTHRRMRKYEAQRRPIFAHQLRHDGRKIMSVGAQAVQPNYAPLGVWAGAVFDGFKPVSYTHLDVYKRQVGGLRATTNTARSLARGLDNGG